jgi:16S rRNA U516 pseudouridylate synthase RsuA-like enzyme
MDEKGARAENEAVIVMSKSIYLDDETPKKLILNKPYWVIMKRKESQNPYFILGVNNTEIMTNK